MISVNIDDPHKYELKFDDKKRKEMNRATAEGTDNFQSNCVVSWVNVVLIGN